MISDLVCKECRGSKAVAYKREHKPIGDTGLERECKIPQTNKDIETLMKVYPKSPPIGYRLAYEWGTILQNEREVQCVFVGMEKIASDEPVSPAEKSLSGKSKAELVEIAVMAGITDADASWNKAKLIADIQAKQGAKAAATG